MMTRHEADGAPQDGDGLDDLFALARGQQAEPSGALMARVLAEARATFTPPSRSDATTT